MCHTPKQEKYEMTNEQDVSPIVRQIQLLQKELEKQRNFIADLSAKFHKMQSSLREFEKQRINPKFESLESKLEMINFSVVKIIDSAIESNIKNIHGRIDELGSKMKQERDNVMVIFKCNRAAD